MIMSLVESDIQSWWEVPSIAHFCSLFRAAFNLLDFDIEDLEEALLTDGTEDSGSSLLRDLIVGLLQGILGNQDVSSYNYQMFLRRVLRQRWENAGLTNPFKDDIDFQFLPLRTKVDILHSLCDYRLDAEDVADLLKNLEADSLRVEPLGADDQNSTYWYFYGTRLYREDVHIIDNRKPNCGPGRKKRKSRKGPRKLELKIGSESDPGSIQNWSAEQDIDKQYIWQVVCYTQDDWLKVTKKFERSESEKERELYKTLKEEFLPEIPRLFSEKERLQRKRLLDAAPRRVSTRIEKLRQQKEEEEKSGGASPPPSPTDDKSIFFVPPDHNVGDPCDAENEKESDTDKRGVESDSVSVESTKMITRSAADRNKVSKLSKVANVSPPHSPSEHDSDTSPESSPSWDSSPSREEIPMDVLPVKTGRRTMNSLSTVEFPIALSPVRKKKRRRSHERKRDEEMHRKSLYRVLRNLKNMEEAYPFLEPVDEEFAPDYYHVVKQPMDLQSMEDKLDSGAYQQLDEFEHDFNLIVVNCKKYNGYDSDYSQMANVLQRAFVKYVDRLERKLPIYSDVESPPPPRKSSKPIVESNPVKSPSGRKTRHLTQQSGKENLDKLSSRAFKRAHRRRSVSPPAPPVRRDSGDKKVSQDDDDDIDVTPMERRGQQPVKGVKETPRSLSPGSSHGDTDHKDTSAPPSGEEMEEEEDFNLSRAERDRRRRTRNKLQLEMLQRKQEMEALEEATEATLKDLNKWLEDPPRYAEYSSRSNSPFHSSAIEDYRVNDDSDSRTKYSPDGGRYHHSLNGSSFAYHRREKLNHWSRKVNRRSNKFGGKFSFRDKRFPGSSFAPNGYMGGMYRKDKNIERLQPGKIKGNLINHCSQKDKMRGTSPRYDSVSSKVRDSQSGSEGDSPKLAMGAVLTVSDFNSAVRYSSSVSASDSLRPLRDKEDTPKVSVGVRESDAFKTSTSDLSATECSVKDSEAGPVVDQSNATKPLPPTEKDAVEIPERPAGDTAEKSGDDPQAGATGQPSTGSKDERPTAGFENKATPNLSAWFKAFGGGPKCSSKRKSDIATSHDEKENCVVKKEKVPVGKILATNQVKSAKCSPMPKVAVQQECPISKVGKEEGKAQSPLNVSTDNVRSPLLTSSESEKSPQTPQCGSWSAEPSPNYPELQQRSPSTLSPRHDVEKQLLYGAYIDRFSNKAAANSALKVGFYQDISVIQKASPNKSGPVSPYSIHSPVFPESPYPGGPKSAIVKPLAPMSDPQPHFDAVHHLTDSELGGKMPSMVVPDPSVTTLPSPVYSTDLSLRNVFVNNPIDRNSDKAAKVGLSYPVLSSVGVINPACPSPHLNPVKKRAYNASPPSPFSPSIGVERGSLIDPSVISYQNKFLKSVHGDLLKPSKASQLLQSQKRNDVELQFEDQLVYPQAAPNFFPSALPGNLANLSQIVARIPTESSLLHRGSGVSVCNSSDLIKESEMNPLKQIADGTTTPFSRGGKHRGASDVRSSGAGSPISCIIPSQSLGMGNARMSASRGSADQVKGHSAILGSNQSDVIAPQVSSSSYLFVTHHQSPFVSSQSRPGTYTLRHDGQQKPCGVAERITPNLGSNYSSAFSGLSVPNIPSPALGFGHDTMIQPGLASPYTKTPFGLPLDQVTRSMDIDKNVRAHSNTPSGSFTSASPTVSQSPIIPQPFSGFAHLSSNSSSVIQSTFQTPRSTCDTALNMSRGAMSSPDVSRSVGESVGNNQGSDTYQGNPPLQQGFGSSSPGLGSQSTGQQNPMSPMQSLPSSGGGVSYEGMRSGSLHALGGVNQSHHPSTLQFSGFTVPPVSQTQGFPSHPTLGPTLSPFSPQPSPGGRAHSSLHPLMNQPIPTRQPFIPGSLMDPNSPLYQQYLHQRQQEEFLLSHSHAPGTLPAPASMMLQQGLIGHTGFPPGYHPSLGIGQTFQGMNRHLF